MSNPDTRHVSEVWLEFNVTRRFREADLTTPKGCHTSVNNEVTGIENMKIEVNVSSIVELSTVRRKLLKLLEELKP